MRCFINVFKADLKRFWNIAWKLYIAFAVYSLMQALIFFANMNKSINKGRIAKQCRWATALWISLKGAKEFYPERNLAMDIQMLEIFVLLFLLFIVAYYINSDRECVKQEHNDCSRVHQCTGGSVNILSQY